MLARLCAAGLPVRFFARRPEVVAAAEAHGATAVDGPRAVGPSSEVVVLCVFDDAQVLDICLGELGLLAGMEPGSILVNHTTGSPATAELLAEQAAVGGVRVLDATVSGGATDIEAGHLTVLAGGEAEVLDAARPVLAAYADPILHVGGLGDGQRVKLLNNALFAAGVAVVSEAERVATELGLDPAAAFAAIAHCSGDSYALRMVQLIGSAAQMREAAGPYLRKDVGVVDALADEAGVDLGLLGAAARRAAAG